MKILPVCSIVACIFVIHIILMNKNARDAIVHHVFGFVSKPLNALLDLFTEEDGQQKETDKTEGQ